MNFTPYFNDTEEAVAHFSFLQIRSKYLNIFVYQIKNICTCTFEINLDVTGRFYDDLNYFLLA